MVLLCALGFRYTYSLCDQTYYLSDTFGVSFLTFVAFTVCSFEVVAIATYLSLWLQNYKRPKSSISTFFLAEAHIAAVIIISETYFEFLSVIKLWFLLLPLVLY
jgi:hypothetical protein